MGYTSLTQLILAKELEIKPQLQELREKQEWEISKNVYGIPDYVPVPVHLKWAPDTYYMRKANIFSKVLRSNIQCMYLDVAANTMIAQLYQNVGVTETIISKRFIDGEVDFRRDTRHVPNFETVQRQVLIYFNPDNDIDGFNGVLELNGVYDIQNLPSLTNCALESSKPLLERSEMDGKRLWQAIQMLLEGNKEEVEFRLTNDAKQFKFIFNNASERWIINEESSGVKDIPLAGMITLLNGQECGVNFNHILNPDGSRFDSRNPGERN